MSCVQDHGSSPCPLWEDKFKKKRHLLWADIAQWVQGLASRYHRCVRIKGGHFSKCHPKPGHPAWQQKPSASGPGAVQCVQTDVALSGRIANTYGPPPHATLSIVMTPLILGPNPVAIVTSVN